MTCIVGKIRDPPPRRAFAQAKLAPRDASFRADEVTATDVARPLDRTEHKIKTSSVTRAEVEAYLISLEEPQQSTLRQLRQAILRQIPNADEGIAYGMPAFRVNGKVIAGFAAFKHHLSYFPHSGSVLSALTHTLRDQATSKGTLRFVVDEPLADELVRELVEIRLRQAFPTAGD